jgi:hypothetical protein
MLGQTLPHPVGTPLAPLPLSSFPVYLEVASHLRQVFSTLFPQVLNAKCQHHTFPHQSLSITGFLFDQLKEQGRPLQSLSPSFGSGEKRGISSEASSRA